MSNNKTYAQGYAAGRRRAEKELRSEIAEAMREDFRHRAFLAALPACIEAQNWRDGEGKPITSLTGRHQLAWDFADRAVKHAVFIVPTDLPEPE